MLFCDLHTLLEQWKELNVMVLGSAFPACCRYFLPDSSKMVIHGIGCTFLSALCSLKNQWWQTWSPECLFCALPGLWLFPRQEGLVLVSTRTHLQGRKSSEWPFDSPVPNPIYILLWSEKPLTKALFKFWEKYADLCLMQCHRLGTTPSGRSFTTGWCKGGLFAHGWLTCTPKFPGLASNCSRLLQTRLAWPPPGLLSCSASSRSFNLGFPTARPFSSCLAFFFFLVHPHNYSSTKSGLVKQQHF